MKLLADAHISRRMMNYLVGLGHDVLHVAALSPRMSDSDILRRAALDKSVVLTADKDFGELCFRRLIPCAGVVLLRLNAPSETSRLKNFQRLWPMVEPNAIGHFHVVSDAAVRRCVLSANE